MPVVGEGATVVGGQAQVGHDLGQGSKTDLGRPDCLTIDKRVPILISA
jgi:hypothetical protein